MNYLEYVDQLVNEFLDKKANAEKAYEVLIKSKSGFDKSKTSEYLGQINDCHAVANLAERLMEDLIDGLVSPFDPID